VPYDREQHERFIDQLIAAFPLPTAGTGRPAAQPGDDSGTAPAAALAVQPLFVCGMFRSGSTLVEQILAGHPDIAPGGELDFLPTLVRNELSPFPQALSHLGASAARMMAARYVDTLTRLHPDARFVVDKRPDNFLYIGLIKTLFPAARIVHTVRDALDNCLSLYFLHLDHGMPYALDLLDTGHYYRQYQRLMAHWRALYGNDIVDVEYDALVREPRPQIERVLGSLGLGWDERCLDFARSTHAVKTASVWQVRQPLYQHASGRARRFAPHLDRLAEYLGVTQPR
jgi:hypothetical protein